MIRRQFLGGVFGIAGGLCLPEPARVRAYSFMPGDPVVWRSKISNRVLTRSQVENIYHQWFQAWPSVANWERLQHQWFQAWPSVANWERLQRWERDWGPVPG